MAKTLSQLQKQIAALKRQAHEIHSKEVAGVIEKIKDAIVHYGLTARDLGLEGGSRKPAVGSKSPKNAMGAKYRDGAGNEWSGRGPRPKWLREALSAGNNLSDFEVSASSNSVRATKAGPKRRKGGRKSAAKFRDSQGNSWTGHGRQPQWFKDAIAQGTTPEQLAT